jgi:hypothetical protein
MPTARLELPPGPKSSAKIILRPRPLKCPLLLRQFGKNLAKNRDRLFEIGPVPSSLPQYLGYNAEIALCYCPRKLGIFPSVFRKGSAIGVHRFFQVSGADLPLGYPPQRIA